jgi:O-antigen/teichoic acid export membrane protein
MIARLTTTLNRVVDLALKRGTPVSDRERRSRSIVQGTMTAILSRGIGSLVGFITVPLTVRYLGAEQYGVWMTISSVLGFLGFTDFGIAASLTNALGKAFGEDDRVSARSYIASTFALFLSIAVLLVATSIVVAKPIAHLLFPQLALPMLDQEVTPALVAALALFAINFPLLVTNRVLTAYQENATANIWLMAGSVANLVGILIVIWFRAGLTGLVIGSTAPALLVNAISTGWLFTSHKPWLRPAFRLTNRKHIAELLSTSWKFFIIGTGWLINSQTDNMVIAHFLGPTKVTPYSVTCRLFAYATLLQAFASGSLWPAYTEAIARRDHQWVSGIYRKHLYGSIGIALVIIVPLVLFGRPIIRWWAGSAAVPDQGLIWWMAAWNLILAAMFVPSTILNATGRVGGMAIYGSFATAVNIVLSIILVQRFGVSGVIAGTVLSFALFAVAPTFWDAARVLKRTCTDMNSVARNSPSLS